ncbi:MAG: type II toxin-antitoxin system HipA family toxin YjjJ [Wenzhouxiangellaceae bacterium]
MIQLRPHLMNGARQAGDLTRSLGISRVTLMHAYERESTSILKFGRARRSSYAARKTYTGLDTDSFPVFRVDESGDLHRAGELVTLEAAESIWLPDDTIIDGLPPAMHDMAPQGFLGRSFTRQHVDLALPNDFAGWSDRHVLLALSRRGEDLAGNLLMGRESFDRWQNLHHAVHTAEDFQQLAEAALAGEHAGSSAGGDQPKFTAYVSGKHRIVKFATEASDNARRWQDLLLLEHHALLTLRDAGIAVANTDIVELPGLRCLMVDRFDRVGLRGRRAVMSLAAAGQGIGQGIDQGSAGSWTDTAEKMHRRGELSGSCLRRLALLEAYGALIANNDRHHHNVLLYPSAHGYELAPAFDQLPMAYAPPASGNLINVTIAPPRASVNTLEVWDEAHRLANEFWRRATTLKLSRPMAEIAREHARR